MPDRRWKTVLRFRVNNIRGAWRASYYRGRRVQLTLGQLVLLLSDCALVFADWSNDKGRKILVRPLRDRDA